ncbi:FHA domain-containing protein, partial [Varibaculum cambriense]
MELESVRQALAAPCHLQVERGPAAGLVLPFAGNYCALGRFQLHDRAVSREHLLFISQPGKLRVRDLGSANGTFRGATASCFSRIRQEKEIGTSSRIRAGSTVLKVSPRPRHLRVPRPRPKMQLGSWRQWLFLPMLVFLPFSLISLLKIPPLVGILIFTGIAILGFGVWFYRRPRPVTPAQLLLVASQSERPSYPPASINDSGEVGAWISPHRVIRAKEGDKLCFTGSYARERALWWATQIAWQEGARYRLDLAVTAADFTGGNPDHPPDGSGDSEETPGEDVPAARGYPDTLAAASERSLSRVVV